MAKTINESNIIGKYVEFHHKIKLKGFKDPGKYRIGTVKKVTDDYVYIRCTGLKHLLRTAKGDVIGQITHSGIKREIEWNKR